MKRKKTEAGRTTRGTNRTRNKATEPESRKPKTRIWKAENYIKNRDEAIEYLRAALETDDPELVSAAVGDVHRSGLLGKIRKRIPGCEATAPLRIPRKRTLNKHRPHNYRVIWIDEYEEYVGLCDDYPSLSWVEKDPKSAMSGIMDLVADVDADLMSEAADEERGMIDRLAHDIRARGISVFGDSDKYDEWLHSPIPALGGVRPCSLLGTVAGMREVMNELVRIEHGVIS
jgi:hypothetical protein